MSDFDLETNFLTGLKERKLSLKAFYISGNLFELMRRSNEVPRPYHAGSLTREDLTKFFLKNVVDKKKNQVIISLEGEGGILDPEKYVLETAYRKGADFSYVGISPYKYTPFNVRKISKNDFKKEFVCADFEAHNFRSEIDFLIGKYSNRIFTSGVSTCNIISTVFADTVSNILKKGELLWITQLPMRTGSGKEQDFKTFDAFCQYIHEPKIMQYFFDSLDYIGIPFQNGKMIIEMDEEKSSGALKFIFSFRFKKKTIATFRGEEIIFLPEEKIELISIRVFHEPTFIKFFEAHNFKCIASETKGNRGQFLFKKTK